MLVSATESSGFCRQCGTVHRLESSRAVAACYSLMEKLEKHQTIELFQTIPRHSHLLITDDLFGKSRGKMFGVLEGVRRNGKTVRLYAFSGQFNGLWDVPGWAPPLFAISEFQKINSPEEKRIKTLGMELAKETLHCARWHTIHRERRKRSRLLMEKIHTLYRLTNFHGETVSLHEAFVGPGGIPTGTGDCCAPKLLNQAAALHIKPLGIAEFFWGKENKSKSRHHGHFYSSCSSKCEPILGFLLCGIDTLPEPTNKKNKQAQQSPNAYPRRKHTLQR